MLYWKKLEEENWIFCVCISDILHVILEMQNRNIQLPLPRKKAFLEKRRKVKYFNLAFLQYIKNAQITFKFFS